MIRPTHSSHSRLLKPFTTFTLLAMAAVAPLSNAQEDRSKPVITTETKKGEDGKDALYMYIDGVKVHELDTSKQPLPPVVKPGEPAGFFAPRYFTRTPTLKLSSKYRVLP